MKLYSINGERAHEKTVRVLRSLDTWRKPTPVHLIQTATALSDREVASALNWLHERGLVVRSSAHLSDPDQALRWNVAKRDDDIVIDEEESAPDGIATVDHPQHYTSHPSGVECIQITEHLNFNVGNAVKYLWRAGLKPGGGRISDQRRHVEDLQKARWYVDRELARLTEMSR